jgi:hypothetical protein
MAVLRTRLNRRALLAVGASGLGVALVARLAGAANLAPGAASSMRPTPGSGSAVICALCGDPSHTMLGGPHGLAAARRR